MAVTQNTFNEDYATRTIGAETDGELSNILTGHLEGATPAPFGAPVFKGVADKGVTLAVSANLRGWLVSSPGLPLAATRPADTFAPGDNVRIKERGGICVDSATAANKDQPVYITPAGKASNASAGNTLAAGWLFDETISAAGAVAIARR